MPSLLCLFFKEIKAKPLVGSELAAAIWVFAYASPKSRSKPMTSPVDFISGPSKTSTFGNLLNGNTASFTAYIFLFLFIKLKFDSFFPVIITEAILAKGMPVAFETKGTVLLALGLTSIT